MRACVRASCVRACVVCMHECEGTWEIKVNIYTTDNQQNMDPENVYLCERSCVLVYVYASLVHVIINVCL